MTLDTALPEGVEVKLLSDAWTSGFVVSLPGISRVGENVTFAVPRRRGRGRYVVSKVEWFYRGLVGEVAVHLEGPEQ